MIFKIQNNNINEGFDFGSMSIESEAASQYTETPDIIRTTYLNDIQPIDVIKGLYQCKPPQKSHYEKIYDPEYMGNINASGPLDYVPNRQHNYWGGNKGLTPRIITLYKQQNFKEFSTRFQISDELSRIPEWLCAFYKYATGGNEIKNLHDSAVVDINYWITPDEGVVIIHRLNVSARPNGQYQDVYYMETDNATIFTGKIIYKVKEVDASTIKAGQNVANIAAKQIGFLNALTKGTCDFTLWHRITEYMNTFTTPNGNLVYCYKPDLDTDPTEWGAYIDRVSILANYHDVVGPRRIMKRGYRNHVLSRITEGAWKNIQPRIQNIIDRYDENTQECIEAYADKDKNFMIYFISNSNVVKKLLGPEGFEHIKPGRMLILPDGWKYRDPIDHIKPLYILLFITDKGMELYNKLIKREITIGEIKSLNK